MKNEKHNSSLKFILGWTVNVFFFAFVHFAVYFGLIDLKVLAMTVAVAIVVSTVQIAYFLSERFRNMVNHVFFYCVQLLQRYVSRVVKRLRKRFFF